MRLAHHLYKHPHSGVFFFQLAIPRTLRPHFQGKWWVRYTLSTKDPAQAKLMAYSHSLHWLEQFRELRLKKPTVQDLINNPDLKDFKLKEGKGGWAIEADGKEDYELGLMEVSRLKAEGIYPSPEKRVMPQYGHPAHIPQEKITIKKAIENLLLENQEALTETRRTKERELIEFRTWVKPQTWVHDINKKTISDYKLHLLSKKPKPNTLRTINKKFIWLNQLFEMLRTGGLYLQDNPVTGQARYGKKKKDKDTEENSALPFEDAELAKIFSPQALAEAEALLFWGSLISVYTAGRVAEVSQLLTVDIDQEKNWLHIRVATSENSLKSKASHRVIPIHQDLVAIGLYDYIKAVEQQQCLQLFMGLEKTTKGWGGLLSQQFSRYLEKIKVKAPRKSFHSLRNNLNQKFSDADIGADFRSAFLGQEIDSVNIKHYTKKYGADQLRRVCLDKVEFGFDIDGLKAIADRIRDNL